MLNDLRLRLAIDLGTSNTVVGVHGKGIIVNEPTLIARRVKKLGKPGEIIAYGTKAKQMLGKEPRQMEVVQLLSQGAIADFDATVEYFKHILNLVNELPSRIPRFLKPEAVIGVPTGITEVEKRAVSSVALKAGIGRVYLVEEPMAVAVGSGLIVDQPAGNLIIDLGGGVTELAVVSLGGIVLNRCLKVAGKQMDDTLVNFLRVKYGVLVGLNGLPKLIIVEKEEVREALSPVIQKIILALNELLEETPPELTADIARRGIVLSGGGSQLEGLEELIERETKMPVWKTKNSITSVADGGLSLLDKRKELNDLKLSLAK